MGYRKIHSLNWANRSYEKPNFALPRWFFKNVQEFYFSFNVNVNVNVKCKYITSSQPWNSYENNFSSIENNNNGEQAGAELCQAQVQVCLAAEAELILLSSMETVFHFSKKMSDSNRVELQMSCWFQSYMVIFHTRIVFHWGVFHWGFLPLR